MTTEIMINMAISQVGEEKSKEVLDQVLLLVDKMSSEKIYIIKKLGKRGVCLISTNTTDCKLGFPEMTEEPDITELENMLRDIEI